jgi:hypothetical protein
MATWHIAILIANLVLVVIGALLSIIFWMARVAFIELKNEVTKLRDQETECLQNLPKDFVPRPEFESWKLGRDGKGGLWEVINKHLHDAKGRVTRP